MNKRIPLLVLLLQGCSATPYLDDYIASLEVPDAYIYFEHELHGLKSNVEDPLLVAFEACNQEVFQGNSVVIRDHELSGFAELEKLNHDYHAFLLENVMMAASNAQEAFKEIYSRSSKHAEDVALSRDAFSYTEGLELPLKGLTRLVLKRNRCLSEKGWLYKRAGF